MTNKEWSLRKKIIVGILVAVCIFAVIIGAIYVAVYSSMGKVKVVSVEDVLYEDYDSDDYGLSGTISTGITQDVTSEQGKVSQILVKEGDYVKKGTPLVRFDATSAQIQLEQAKIDLQTKQVDLNNAHAKLDMLNNAQSYVQTIKVPVSNDQDESTTDEDSESEDSKDSKDSSDSNDSNDSSDSKSDTDDSSSDNTSSSDDGTATSSDSTKSDSTSSKSDQSSSEDDSKDEDSDVEYQEVVVESDEPQFQTSDGEVYTESELRKEKSKTSSEISSLEIDIKEAQAGIESAQEELNQCTVTSTLDGYVTKVSSAAMQSDEETVVSEDEESEDMESTENASAAAMMEDDGIVVQVSSMDGLYVNSAINEWKLQKYGVGDVVYVMDWQSGNTYEATITTISPYASEAYAESYQYMGGSKESYYPFSAQINEDGTGLESGDYVDISFTKPTSSQMESMEESGTLSIMKAFVRTENGKKYVYVQDENNKLHKQEVVISAQSQESYTIADGLSVDDYIAFPYGKNIREGANTIEGSIEDLYE